MDFTWCLSTQSFIHCIQCQQHNCAELKARLTRRWTELHTASGGWNICSFISLYHVTEKRWCVTITLGVSQDRVSLCGDVCVGTTCMDVYMRIAETHPLQWLNYRKCGVGSCSIVITETLERSCFQCWRWVKQACFTVVELCHLPVREFIM